MTILDILNLDLKQFSEKEFEIAYEGINIEGNKFIDYEKFISPKILGVFDKIQLKIFADKFEVSTNVFISVMLFASKGKANTSEIRNVIEILHNAFGDDSNGKRMFTVEDIKRLKLGIFDRNWDLSPNGESLNEITDNSYAVRVSYNSRNMSTIDIEPEYFSLCIWRVNKILDKPIESISISKSNNKNTRNQRFSAKIFYLNIN